MLCVLVATVLEEVCAARVSEVAALVQCEHSFSRSISGCALRRLEAAFKAMIAQNGRATRLIVNENVSEARHIVRLNHGLHVRQTCLHLFRRATQLIEILVTGEVALVILQDVL